MAKKRQAKKKTQTQLAYEKNLRRIKSFIRRAEKRGYQFPENAIPTRPKRITQASVRKLEKIKPETLYKKAKYGGEASEGEVVAGLKGLQLEKTLRGRRAAEARAANKARKAVTGILSDIAGQFDAPRRVSEDTSFFDNTVLSNFMYHISQFNDRANALIRNWLDRIMTSHGRHAAAIMLNEATNAGVIIDYKVVYDPDKLMGRLADFLEYLPDAGDIFKEDLMEAMEEEGFMTY